MVLGWIKGYVTKLKTFFANRVSEILETSSPLAWWYVPTDCNPADLISRGVDAKHFNSVTLWWSDPCFLRKNETEWPHLNVKVAEVLPELKTHTG